MQKNKINSDSLVIGLALFAMFFGAGNLIFPPFIGMKSGNMWWLGFLIFFIFDIGLAFVAVVSMINGTIGTVTDVIGKIPSIILTTSMMVCIGPLLAIPRTAALTYQMMFQQFLPFSFKEGTFSAFLLMFACSIIYFLITYLFTIKPSKVIDIVGTFLTPLMVILLLAMIVLGIINPIGKIPAPEDSSQVVSLGVQNGYQTMDVLGGLGMAMVVCATVTSRGYKDKKNRTKVAARACIIAGILLFVVYGGLAYLGGTYAAIDNSLKYKTANDSIVTNIANNLLGNSGGLTLGIIVGLACLTTSIGLTSATSMFFEDISNGKAKYKISVLVICILSTFLSCLGLETIISFAAPILSIIYPVVITLIIMSLFKLKNHNIHKGATLAAFIVSLFTIGNLNNLPFEFIEKLPLYKFQLNWIVPAIIGGIIGAFIKSKNNKETS